MRGSLQTRAWRCIKARLHSTPLRRRFYRQLPRAQVSPKVSGGKSKVSRRVWLPRSSRAPRSSPKNGLSLFLVAFSRLLFCRHGGATGFLLACRVLFLRPPLFTPPPLHHHCRGKIEDHGLGALAKANDYQRGAHRDKDSLRDCKKQIVQPVHKQIK
jgi:hypothetical protein